MRIHELVESFNNSIENDITKLYYSKDPKKFDRIAQLVRNEYKQYLGNVSPQEVEQEISVKGIDDFIDFVTSFEKARYRWPMDKDAVEEQVPYLQRPNSGYPKAVAHYLRLNPGKTEDDWKELSQIQQEKYLSKYVEENFADGKKKGKSKPGRVKKAGASCDGSVTSLRKKAKNSSGEKSKMFHWCANMKSKKKKSK